MGRHREFDVEEALDAAMRVFWLKGYEGASYTDLTAATGVERPALYSAFGNKEALFRKALDRYYDHYMDFIPKALELPTAREVATAMLHSALELHTEMPDRRGCLGINGALAGSDDSAPIREMMIAARAEGEAKLRARFERAQAEGDLPESASPEALAAFILAVSHGMAVQAKAGFCRDKLRRVADQALATWPS